MGFLSCLIQKRFHLCQHTLILHTLEKGVIFVLRRKKIRCRRKRHRLKLLVPVFLLIGLFFVIECQLSPLVEKAAASQAKQMFNQSVNDAVTSQLNNKGITYTDLIHIEKATDGSVLAVTTDSLNQSVKSRYQPSCAVGSQPGKTPGIFSAVRNLDRKQSFERQRARYPY